MFKTKAKILFFLFITVIVLAGYFIFFSKEEKSIRARLLWKKSFTEIKAILDKYKRELPPQKNRKKSYNVHMYLSRDKGLLLDDGGLVSKIFAMDGSKIWEKSIQKDILIGYDKVGKMIELYNTEGMRLWKLNTFRYPRFSPGGMFFLLINGDSSRISLLDLKKQTIIPELAFGHILTTMAWSKDESKVALGFLDGTLVVANSRGEILISQKINLPGGNDNTEGHHNRFSVIKSISLSYGGSSTIVHYGLLDKDYIALFNHEDSTGDKASPKNRQRIKPQCVIPMESSVPFEIPLALSPGPRPILVFMDKGKLSFYNYKCNIIKNGDIFIKSGEDTKQELQEYDINGFHYLTFSQKGDLSFLGYTRDHRYLLQLFQKRGTILEWKKSFFINAGRYARTHFFDLGRYLLVEGNDNLHYFQLYPEEKN